MKILIVSIYSDRDSVGIAKYTADMAEWFSQKGNDVEVIAAVPHYPEWKVHTPYKNWFFQELSRYKTYYVPTYIPNINNISTLRRLIYEASFGLAIIPILIKKSLKRENPDISILIYPSMPSVIIGYIYSKMNNVRSIIHVQDLQAAAADSLKMVKVRFLSGMLKKIESIILSKSDQVTTITPKMAENIEKITNNSKKVLIVHNWADIENIVPCKKPVSAFGLNNLDEQFNIMYAGSMGEKQGLHIILEVAKILQREPVKFIISGDGPYKNALIRGVIEQNLSNVAFLPRQDASELSKLLSIADVHLIIQRKDATDLVMPSKLTNIAAAGRTVIATATPDSGLGNTVVKNALGIISTPENPEDLAEKIIGLISDIDRMSYYSKKSREYAEQNLSIGSSLENLESIIKKIVKGDLK
ncbi:glycosyltransferase WbuB [Deinococcus indicus]|nr:glycosyltransferase WbuB [Deinococcus indicus]